MLSKQDIHLNGVVSSLDRIGGIGRYQMKHFFATGMFWFLGPGGVLMLTFINGEPDPDAPVATEFWSNCTQVRSAPCPGLALRASSRCCTLPRCA